MLARHAWHATGLRRRVAIVYAGIRGVMTVVAISYGFPAPLAFVAATFLCFVL